MTFMTFHSVGNVIIPTDELIFFRGVGIPPTSNVIIMGKTKTIHKNDPKTAERVFIIGPV